MPTIRVTLQHNLFRVGTTAQLVRYGDGKLLGVTSNRLVGPLRNDAYWRLMILPAIYNYKRMQELPQLGEPGQLRQELLLLDLDTRAIPFGKSSGILCDTADHAGRLGAVSNT